MPFNLLTPQKAISRLQESNDVLRGILSVYNAPQASALRDGADGWTILEVVCHLRDFEQVFMDRARLIIGSDRPQIVVKDHLQMVIDNRYPEADFSEAVETLTQRRASFIELLKELTPDQWDRVGVHPEAGEYNVSEQAYNAIAHDITHMAQILKCR